MMLTTDKVILLTATFYQTKSLLRYNIALETIKKATKDGYKIIIVDDSPLELNVAEDFKNLGAIVYRQTEKGIGGSRRQVFSIGAKMCKELGYEAVLWLEPEKDDLIKFIPEIVKPILEGKADISIPFRTEISWKSYPIFQIESEKEGNKIVAELIHRNDLDSFFGPVAYSADATKYVINIKPIDIGGGKVVDNYVPQYAPTLALRHGVHISSVPIDFIYNPQQKKEEETTIKDEMLEKRRKQLFEVSEAHKKLATMELNS